jgi:tetratricopeptide (TPR) repeat protein
MQHPDFDEFKQCYRAAQYEQALTLIDRLIAKFPQSGALRWHQFNCLEKLERFTEIPAVLEVVLQRMPDYVPALLKRVLYADCYLDQQAPLHADDDYAQDAQSADVRKARENRDVIQREIEQRNISDLRRVIRLADTVNTSTSLPVAQLAQAQFLLANALRYSESEQVSEESVAEAHRLIDQAILLCPQHLEYRLARADAARSRALVVLENQSIDAEPSAEIVSTLSGVRYKRADLEAAAEDYQYCWEQGKSAGHAMKLASTLHDLGRYEQALNVYDSALAQMPEDAPHREYFIERRKLSENNGAGEREQMAQLMLSGLDNGSKDRSLQDSMATQAMLGAAQAIRDGASVSDAIAAHMSDDPDTMQAMNIARQILNVAHEPPPELLEVDAGDYPAYQRQYCQKIQKAAEKIGMIKIADAEAMGLFNVLGQHVMLRLFRDESGEIGLASFTMKPKWPGLIAFLVMFLTGKWKQHQMIECVTTFDDGAMITTQPQSISPFEYGGKIIQNKLSPNIGVAELVAAHQQSIANYVKANSSAQSIRVSDLAGVEARWVAGQELKAAYRESINYISDQELRGMLGAHYERFAEKIREQIKVMTAYS